MVNRLHDRGLSFLNPGGCLLPKVAGCGIADTGLGSYGNEIPQTDGRHNPLDLSLIVAIGVQPNNQGIGVPRLVMQWSEQGRRSECGRRRAGRSRGGKALERAGDLGCGRGQRGLVCSFGVLGLSQRRQGAELNPIHGSSGDNGIRSRPFDESTRFSEHRSFRQLQRLIC